MNPNGGVALPSALHVALPTRDGSADVVTVASLVRDVAAAVARPVRLHVGEASNIPRARNVCLRLAEAAQAGEARQGRVWVLWVDSDIRLEPSAAGPFARYLARAEAEQAAFAAHYRQADGRSTFFLRRGRMVGPALEAAVVAGLADWSALGMSGFGLLYAPIEPGYVFHADDAGEDIHFWVDHPDLSLHFAKAIAVRHRKAILL